jgi:hypothetical protein
VLTGLRHRLDMLLDSVHTRAGAADADAESLTPYTDYLVNELNPVLHSLALRVRPPLRRLGITGPDADAASEYARLLRLTEQATVARDEHAHAETEPLIDQIAQLADGALGRAVDTLPALLAGLASDDAARIVAAAQRTAHAGRQAAHLELAPGLL